MKKLQKTLLASLLPLTVLVILGAGGVAYYVKNKENAHSVVPQENNSISNGSEQGTTTTTLQAPMAAIANAYGVGLLLLDRECDKTYTIERSYNQRDWEHVATTTFFKHEHDPDRPACEKDYVDSSVAKGTIRLFYRYGLLDNNGNVVVWSDVGEVNME